MQEPGEQDHPREAAVPLGSEPEARRGQHRSPRTVGRRLGDDVIDIAEQAVGGFLKGTKLPLGDGVNADDRKLMPSFPYIADPQSGFDDTKGK